MTIRQIFMWILLAAAAGALPAPAWTQDSPAAAQDEYEARLTEVKGDVTVFTSEDPEGGPGVAEMPLSAGDRLKTGRDGSAEVTFSGEHCVSLRPNSQFTIAAAGRSELTLTLSLGSLLAKVQSLMGGSFRVQTPAAVAAVRGTEFAVEVSADNPDEVHVGVFDEGRVEVSGETGPPELLKSNQETMVRRGSRPLAAYYLRRMQRQRDFMRAFRKRAQAVRKGWRSLPIEQRLQKRRELMGKMQQLRQQRRERLEKLQKKARRKAVVPHDKEKLDKIKDAIRKRRHKPKP